MIKIYSIQGLRKLNQLENGCDANFYLVFNRLYLRVVMKNDKYFISFQKMENGGNYVMKENLTLEEVKQTIKEMVQ